MKQRDDAIDEIKRLEAKLSETNEAVLIDEQNTLEVVKQRDDAFDEIKRLEAKLSETNEAVLIDKQNTLDLWFFF